jgi:hypothetical protein
VVLDPGEHGLAFVTGGEQIQGLFSLLRDASGLAGIGYGSSRKGRLNHLPNRADIVVGHPYQEGNQILVKERFRIHHVMDLFEGLVQMGDTLFQDKCVDLPVVERDRNARAHLDLSNQVAGNLVGKRSPNRKAHGHFAGV